jgi:hypothetical protein
VWSRDIAGLRLTFHLAGINNQNFLMRDEETGTYWQQISGSAIYGPMKGRQLDLIPSDELTFGLWKSEEPQGTVLSDVPRDSANYYPKDWEVQIKSVPTVLSFPEHGLQDRDLMLGIHHAGASRAFLYEQVLREKLVKDQVGGDPVLLVVGPDDESVRAFRDHIPGAGGSPDFYRLTNKPGVLLMDDATGSEWNFQGCAVSGQAQGTCLERIPAIKDFWFDWRNYNPKTTVFSRK